MSRLIQFVAAAALSCVMTQVNADTSSPLQSKHQMMKECMAKEAASDAGLTKEQMKKTCRDVTKTEEENAQTERSGEQNPASAPASSGG